MALKETTKHLKDLLISATHDLDKAEGGNKAASQRVRTGTVKLEKVAKLYRKESIKSERGTKKPSSKKSSATKKPAAKKAAKVKGKAKSHKSVSRPRSLSFRKPTAKLPTKKSR